jgi:hypothetical protein
MASPDNSAKRAQMAPYQFMNEFIKNTVRRAARGFFGQMPLFRRARGDSFDINEVAFFLAAVESARFHQRHMQTAKAFGSDLQLLEHAMGLASAKGLILEFGVATGRTIRHIAGLSPRLVHGFDSFEGLPEYWRTGYDKGAFTQNMPTVPDNVRLHRGWFSETLAPFLSGTEEPVALLHIDCDLYSSTAFVLKALKERIVEGTVVVFDEYFNYPGWKQHEHRALQEFAANTGIRYRFDSYVPSHQQVCVVVENRVRGP